MNSVMERSDCLWDYCGLMQRRRFLSSLAAFAATSALDPEKLLWRPGEKTIFVPPVPRISGADIQYSDAELILTMNEFVERYIDPVIRQAIEEFQLQEGCGSSIWPRVTRLKS